MINSMQIANEFMSLLPEAEVPEKTTDYQGFFHLHDLNGTVEKTVL
jgi:tripeptide aminopeptidase